MWPKPLAGTTLVTLALNVPGPVAASRLAGLGATVIKVEPPAGDPLRAAAPVWYDQMTRGQKVIGIDLKNEQGRSRLDELLAVADLLLTSFRPSALRRLHLDWESVHQRHPRLCSVNIVGHAAPEEEIPGHDLTYQAKLGLLRPPELPVTLHADLAGAERAVSTCLALLINRMRDGPAEFANVSLFDAMRDVAGPRAAGLTTSVGILGGGFPFYGVYQSNDGWIALAALEPTFVARLKSELALSEGSHQELERIFRTRSAGAWEEWARAHDLPIVALI